MLVFTEEDIGYFPGEREVARMGRHGAAFIPAAELRASFKPKASSGSDISDDTPRKITRKKGSDPSP